MAPYNGQYRTHYDPVGSSYTQQHHQSYYTPSDPQRSTQTSQSQPQSQSQSQSQPAAPTGYQAATYSGGYPGQRYYDFQSTESRAAETLSHLSAQDPASTRATASQYDTASRAGTSSWNNSDRSATTQQHDPSSWQNVDNSRRTANPPPLYQNQQSHLQKSATSAANYSPVQSYSQPQDSTNTYSYDSYSRSDQPGTQSGTAQSTAHMFPTSNFRPSSPYVARQQQQQQQQQQTSAQRSSISSVASTATRERQQATSTPTLPTANVGQPRAPSVTPSSVHQQHASTSYNRQTAASDTDHNYTHTVDPTQVYDPWPEQQRKLAEARRKADLEEERRAKEEAEKEAKRQAEEEAKRMVEEQKRKRQDEEAKKRAQEKEAEERRKWAELKREAEEEQRRKEAEERKRKAGEQEAKAKSLRIAREAAAQERAAKRKQDLPMFNQPRQTQDAPGTHQTVSDGANAGNASTGAAPPQVPQTLETEMVAIFRKMRDLNQMDPAMFARMWENERQAHIAKNQLAQPPATQNTTSPTPTPVPAQSGISTPVRGPAYTSAVRHPQPRAPPMVATVHPAASQIPAANGQSRVTPVSARSANATWPPGKRSTLAETATKWLNGRPENAKNPISLEAVVELLAPNPSYMSLCESLERRGLQVDRAQFARALLSVVPDSAKVKPATSTLPSAVASSLPPTTTTASAPVMIPPAPTAGVTPTGAKASRPNNNGKFPGKRGRPSKERLAALQNDRQVVDLTRDSVTPRVNPPSYQPPVHIEPLTVAYQSGFQYDMPDDSMPDVGPSYTQYQLPAPPPTQVQHLQKQSGRNYVSPYFPPHSQAPSVAKPTPPPPAPRPPPANKTEAARKRTFSELVDLSAMNSDSEDDMPPTKQSNTQQYDNLGPAGQYALSLNGNYNPRQYMFNGHAGPTYHPRPVPSQPAAPAQPAILNRVDELRNQVLVEPIRRDKVARKSRYDARTICRDVLLATGRHPDMPALNQHLNDLQPVLKDHSTHIDLDKFDLATIRWDLIDPGEPVSEHDDTAAEDSASGREHQEATDADDEDEELAVTSEAAPQTFKANFHPITANPSTNASSPAPTTRVSSAAPQVVAVQITTSSNQGQKKPFPKRKVGRPRKSLPAPASAAEDGVSEQAARRVTDVYARAASNALSSTPANRPKLQTPNMSTPTGTTGYAAFKSLVPTVDENGNPVKKKGRPVGWRKSVHSKAALAAQSGGDNAIPSSSSKGLEQRTRVLPAPNYGPPIRRRSKQPKAADPPPPPEVEAEFTEFKCEWEDCKAKLHNVDTLRKHVVKVHGKPTSEGDYECSWLGCFAEDEMTCFDTMSEWMGHMEEMHVKPMARKLGDGPSAGLSEPYSSKISDAYLSDSRGRRVTPRISMTPPPEGSKEHEMRQERAAAAWRITNYKGQRLEDELMLQQFEQRARILGPVFMPFGPVLVTDEMRENFLDDEDFSDYGCDDLEGKPKFFDGEGQAISGK